MGLKIGYKMETRCNDVKKGLFTCLTPYYHIFILIQRFFNKSILMAS